MEKQQINKSEKNDMELKFKKINLHEIQKKMRELPLTPCIQCETYVNHQMHNQHQCALFQHEKQREKETSSEYESIESDDETTNEYTNYNWRQINPHTPCEQLAKKSFETNTKRNKRIEAKQNQTMTYEQPIKNKSIFSNPSYNPFKWNSPENTTPNYNCPNIPFVLKQHKLNNIINFLNRKIKRTICLEGNIAAGKSTILSAIKELGNIDVLTLNEPLKQWTNIHDTNLLQLMYENPTKWATSFQSFALLTMAQNHTTTGKIKFLERSIYSTKYIFLEANKKNGNIDEVNFTILNNWFNFIITTIKIKINTIIYIKTNPKIAFQRLQKRSRPEETGIQEKYIEQIHQLYENWLTKGKFAWPCQILILDGNKTTEEILQDLNEQITLIL